MIRFDKPACRSAAQVPDSTGTIRKMGMHAFGCAGCVKMRRGQLAGTDSLEYNHGHEQYITA